MQGQETPNVWGNNVNGPLTNVTQLCGHKSARKARS